jgi:hypothetical protein
VLAIHRNRLIAIDKTDMLTLWADRDNITDPAFPIRDYHPTREQFYPQALLLKVRFGQALFVHANRIQ